MQFFEPEIPAVEFSCLWWIGAAELRSIHILLVLLEDWICPWLGVLKLTDVCVCRFGRL